MRPEFIALLVLLTSMHAAHASFSLATKNRATGPLVHATFFLTPNNNPIKVSAKAYVGKFNNGRCLYNEIYDMGTEEIASGDLIEYDAIKLKFIIGLSYNCVSVYYTAEQLVIDTFILVNNGFIYTTSIPRTTEVTIDGNQIRREIFTSL